ncbi:MAG: hypothetical protein K0Q79_1529 [Flavipsychrobacter sp.]|jgi:hypothetical protein|nr:hypothetical protein [Flavipsychrobacter sp.]
MSKLIAICTWIGRISSVLLGIFIILIGLMVLGSGKNTSVTDLIGLFFAVLLVVGLFLSWPWELAGIIMAYAGIAGITILMLSMGERGIYKIAYIAIPTTILLICRIATHRKPFIKTI